MHEEKRTPDDPYYHNRVMGRTYAEQDIEKIEALRTKVTEQELHQAIQVQIAQYEGKLAEAMEVKDKAGVAHYKAYLATFKARLTQ